MNFKNSLFLGFLLFINTSNLIFAQNLIFEAGFNNTLESTEGESPKNTANVDFTAGFFAEGVLMQQGAILQYDVLNNIQANKGSMSLWVKPNWTPGDTLRRIFVVESNPVFEFHVDESSSLVLAMFSDKIETRVVSGDASNWNATDWHFLVFNWDQTKVEIFVDGVKISETEVGFEIPTFETGVFNVGSIGGWDSFSGTLDELKIYDAPLSASAVIEKYEADLGNNTNVTALSIHDIFGRDVTQSGLTLVDWEGPIRNPAMEYLIQANDSLSFPLVVSLSTQEGNTSFSLPSTVSPTGPTKTIVLDSIADLESFLFSFYMDKDYDDESFDLYLDYNLNGQPARQIVPVTVIDQDYDRDLSYPVVVDFSEAVHPLMVDPKTQDLIVEAAEDWLYYIDGDNIDEIPTGGSALQIGGQDHFFAEKEVSNPVPYTGYYLYAFGNSNSGPCVCSTGSPNRELLQSNNGETVPIFRIGALHLNVFGQAFETEPTGWEVVSPYDNWTFDGYFGVDMYSLAKHEIGHAMVFENAPLFLLAQGRDPNNPFPDESIMNIPNGFTSPALDAYYPDKVVPLFVESLSHIIRVLDPASQTPPYGGGVENPVMPFGREMLTKLDVLIMESVGYPLRDNAVTRSLSLSAIDDFDGDLETIFETSLVAEGGIPVYDFSLLNGVLPRGLSLDRSTGIISGTPEEEGEFPVTFQVRDYDKNNPAATYETTIRIGVVLSNLAELISFNFDSSLAILETSIDTNALAINFQLAQGADITNLTPLIQISEGATIVPAANVPQDFTNPVNYTVTSEDGQVTQTWTITLDVVTSIKDAFAQSLLIYPNPADQELVIQREEYQGSSLRLELFNIQGQLKRSLQFSARKAVMPLNDLPEGIYFLRVSDETGNHFTQKVMIAR